MGEFTVIRTPAFDLLAKEYTRAHPNLEADIVWLSGRLEQAPELMGDHVPELRGLALPIFKTRCKDSCHQIGASGAWRIYYALNKLAKKVFLLFLHHKKESENPGAKFLLQKLERAFASAPKPKPGS
ncbi:MAG: hypothetical protein L0Z50_08900 [Verrucomicrobiales bacterium]|nr:hypothetical protein [Verrucomicrobiales bacterium]